MCWFKDFLNRRSIKKKEDDKYTDLNNVTDYDLTFMLEDSLNIRAGFADAIMTKVDESYENLNNTLDESLNMKQDNHKITRYEIKHQSLKSDMKEFYPKLYRKVETISKIWYIPIQDNAADDIHVFIKGDGGKIGRFQGYGGATLNFSLEDGTIDRVKAPWHSNSIALYNDTGIDLRDKTLTIGAIGKDRVYEGQIGYLEDLLYEDKDWVLGSFDRIRDMAQKFADDLGIKVWYYSQSTGGSSTCWLYPTGIEIPFKN